MLEKIQLVLGSQVWSKTKTEHVMIVLENFTNDLVSFHSQLCSKIPNPVPMSPTPAFRVQHSLRSGYEIKRCITKV